MVTREHARDHASIIITLNSLAASCVQPTRTPSFAAAAGNDASTFNMSIGGQHVADDDRTVHFE